LSAWRNYAPVEEQTRLHLLLFLEFPFSFLPPPENNETPFFNILFLCFLTGSSGLRSTGIPNSQNQRGSARRTYEEAFFHLTAKVPGLTFLGERSHPTAITPL